jgi:hypothetical protein
MIPSPGPRLETAVKSLLSRIHQYSSLPKRPLAALLLTLATAHLASAQIGDGFADVVLGFYDSGSGGLAGPYGGTYPGGPGFVIPVSPNVVPGGESVLYDCEIGIGSTRSLRNHGMGLHQLIARKK